MAHCNRRMNYTDQTGHYILASKLVQTPLTEVYRCVAALDVHQAKLAVCVLYENGWRSIRSGICR